MSHSAPSPVPHPTSEPSATASLVAEHRQMETLLAQLVSVTEAGFDLQAARRLFEAIQQDMRIHFACEEWVLFPMMAPHRSMVLMEVEHDEIFARRDAVAQALARGGSQGEVVPVVKSFVDYLTTHIREEDTGVFPFCESRLSVAEKERVVEGMARLRGLHQQEPLPAIVRAETAFQLLPSPANQPEQANQPEPTVPKAIQLKAQAQGECLEIKRLVLQPGAALASHWTPHQLVVVCLRGRFVYEAKGADETTRETHTLQPGDAVVMTPRLYYALSVPSTAAEESEALLMYQALLPDRFEVGQVFQQIRI